jgi:large subunit ribosomal protein L17
MHRHGYQGRKFGRERNQRSALIKGLATSLVEHGKIETTLPKAKEIVPYVEDLITKAKKGDLHNRRQIIAALSTVTAAHKLVDDIAPKLGVRDSGHLRIKQSRVRIGDNAQLAIVSFVDDLTAEAKPAEKPKAAATPAAGKALQSDASAEASGHDQAKTRSTREKK